MTRDERTQKFYDQVMPHLPVVLRTAKFLCRNQEEADDLVQDTLLKAFNNLESFKPGTNMQHWLMAILRNTRIDRVRSGARRNSDVPLTEDFDLADDRTPGPPELAGQASGADEATLLNALSDQVIIDALHELPEDIRWTLLLVDVHGHDLSEAAAVLGVPAGTVKSRCFRGRAMLREKLSSHAKSIGLAGRS